MLDAVRLEKMSEGVDALPFHVVLPPEWKDYFTRRGPLPSQKDEDRRYARSYFRMQALMDLTQTAKLGDNIAGAITSQVRGVMGQKIQQPDQLQKFMDTFSQRYAVAAPSTAIGPVATVASSATSSG